jgi:hypothetical protein
LAWVAIFGINKNTYMKKIYTIALLIAATKLFSQAGLVSSYPFNGNANDAVGSYNGTVFGATLTTDRFGNQNSAYSFNGSNAYIDLNSAFDLPQRTVSFWAYITSDASVPQGIFSSDNTSLQYGNTNFEIDKYSLGVLQFAMSVGGNVALSSTNISQWYLLTSTWDGSTAKFYVDGSLVSTGTSTSNAKSADGHSTALVGCSRKKIKYFNGKIDDIKVFNRALTEAEVAGITAIDDAFNPLADSKVFFNVSNNSIVVDFNEMPAEMPLISVFNSTGQVVYKSEADGQVNMISASTLGATGVYFVSVSDNGKTLLNRKVVIH